MSIDILKQSVEKACEDDAKHISEIVACAVAGVEANARRNSKMVAELGFMLIDILDNTKHINKFGVFTREDILNVTLPIFEGTQWYRENTPSQTIIPIIKNIMKDQYIKIDEYGNKFYYSNKQLTIYHREDGPAYESLEGQKGSRFISKAWYVDGKRHRIDGPAIEWHGGRKEWWVDNKPLTEAEFNELARPKKDCSGQVVVIDGVTYDGVTYKLVKA